MPPLCGHPVTVATWSAAESPNSAATTDNMKASREDALLILERWKNSSAVIAIISEVANFQLKLTCRIHDIVGDDVQLSCNEFNSAVLNIANCEFKFGDPREFPHIQNRAGDHNYDLFLIVQFPPKELTMLFEVSDKAKERVGLE